MLVLPKTMIVTVALQWFDEPADMLEQAILSVGPAADRLVAVDGAYARFPDAKPSSPKAQARAIRKAAKMAGLECLIITPDRVWAGQCEKRTAMYALAGIDSDWIMVLDTDHRAVGDAAILRKQLETTTHDVLEVNFYTPAGEGDASTSWAAGMIDRTVREPCFFRALPGFRVERFHWYYSALKDGQRHWLRGGDGGYPYLDHGFVEGDYRIEHQTMFRQPKQILANRAFCNDRVMVIQMTGQEDDRPDLPRPVFDYESRLV